MKQISRKKCLKFELRDGSPVLVKLSAVDFIDDKEGKPIGINQHIGRRPIAAFGNSDGDLQMLQYTGAGSGSRSCLYVHHTDAEREYAYDRTDSMARLDKGLDEAAQRGWTGGRHEKPFTHLRKNELRNVLLKTRGKRVRLFSARFCRCRPVSFASIRPLDFHLHFETLPGVRLSLFPPDKAGQCQPKDLPVRLNKERDRWFEQESL